MKNLTAIDHTKKEATFVKLNSPNSETEVVKVCSATQANTFTLSLTKSHTLITNLSDKQTK